jgi:hypothetical protein
MIDMDLVVLIDDENAGLDPSHLVQMMGDLLERVSSLVYACDLADKQETNFVVKPLPKARIPILKLTLAPSPALPFGKLTSLFICMQADFQEYHVISASKIGWLLRTRGCF